MAGGPGGAHHKPLCPDRRGCLLILSDGRGDASVCPKIRKLHWQFHADAALNGERLLSFSGIIITRLLSFTWGSSINLVDRAPKGALFYCVGFILLNILVRFAASAGQKCGDEWTRRGFTSDIVR